MGQYIHFMLGIAVACSTAIGLYFFRFWSGTRDRLFMIFAMAFWLMALGWLAQAVITTPEKTGPTDETTFYVYIPRLLAFACIIWGIWDKNRAAERAAKGQHAGT
ncbi:MAG TPA: DUF5985 family protein [Phycisphaerales bacterium]|nr:DUF5985 family protein [Phycisphaerales bacterium]